MDVSNRNGEYRYGSQTGRQSEPAEIFGKQRPLATSHRHQCAGDYGKNRRRSDNCWIAWEPEQADGVDRPMHQDAPISESEGERMALSAEMRPGDDHCSAQYSACWQQDSESHGGRLHLQLIKKLPELGNLNRT